MLDMRAHGESGGRRFSSWLASRDVLAAVEFLNKRTEVDAGRIGALGLSSGAYAALCAAAQTEDIRALFLDGVGLGRTSDALHPMLKEFRPNFFMTPLNWMYFAMIDVLTSGQGERPIRKLVEDSMPRAIIFVAAGLDPFEPALAERYAGLGGDSDSVSYWVTPDANHVGGMFTHPEEYAEKMLGFFDRFLLEAQ
jgi:acetyl esterase/lipase